MEQSAIKIGLIMELIFNELSIQPLSSNAYTANERMKIFSQAVGAARQKGFNMIRSNYFAHQIQLTSDYTLNDWLINKQIPQEYRDLLYGMITPPFINEEDEEIENQYIKSKYFFEDTASNINKTECLGLASAYLYETISISFDSLPIWRQTQLQIIIENEQSTETGNVFNVYSKSSFDQQDILNFVEAISEIELQETALVSDDKNIHLADHHGKNELQHLCDKLKHSPYITEMRSTEWCRGKCNEFIKKCSKDGTIQIVLYKTERKYSLKVQSTGRNFRETKAIGEILKERYS